MAEEASVKFQDVQLAATHVVSHPRLLDVVRDLDSDPERISSANKNPRGYLTEKGFQLPPGSTVKFSRHSSVTITICSHGICERPAQSGALATILTREGSLEVPSRKTAPDLHRK
jgi:hypothetical protein